MRSESTEPTKEGKQVPPVAAKHKAWGSAAFALEATAYALDTYLPIFSAYTLGKQALKYGGPLAVGILRLTGMAVKPYQERATDLAQELKKAVPRLECDLILPESEQDQPIMVMIGPEMELNVAGDGPRDKRKEAALFEAIMFLNKRQNSRLAIIGLNDLPWQAIAAERAEAGSLLIGKDLRGAVEKILSWYGRYKTGENPLKGDGKTPESDDIGMQERLMWAMLAKTYALKLRGHPDLDWDSTVEIHNLLKEISLKERAGEDLHEDNLWSRAGAVARLVAEGVLSVSTPEPVERRDHMQRGLALEEVLDALIGQPGSGGFGKQEIKKKSLQGIADRIWEKVAGIKNAAGAVKTLESEISKRRKEIQEAERKYDDERKMLLEEITKLNKIIPKTSDLGNRIKAKINELSQLKTKDGQTRARLRSEIQARQNAIEQIQAEANKEGKFLLRLREVEAEVADTGLTLEQLEERLPLELMEFAQKRATSLSAKFTKAREKFKQDMLGRRISDEDIKMFKEDKLADERKRVVIGDWKRILEREAPGLTSTINLSDYRDLDAFKKQVANTQTGLLIIDWPGTP